MIIVKVHAPKRCKGEHSFDDYREFYRWMATNFKRPANLKAAALVAIAERGHFAPSQSGLDIECTCDNPVGYSAKEMARKIGFLKTRSGGDGGYDLKKVTDYLEKLSLLS